MWAICTQAGFPAAGQPPFGLGPCKHYRLDGRVVFVVTPL
jgi:hypothetical protein